MPLDPIAHLQADVGLWRVEIHVPTPGGTNHATGSPPRAFTPGSARPFPASEAPSGAAEPPRTGAPPHPPSPDANKLASSNAREDAAVRSGSATRRLSGGRWLQTSFRTDSGDFEGEGLTGYDPDRGWVATWVDNLRPFLAVMQGTWDEATATMTFVGEATVGGAPLRWRETETHAGPDRREHRTWRIGPDGVEVEAVRAIWTRVG